MRNIAYDTRPHALQVVFLQSVRPLDHFIYLLPARHCGDSGYAREKGTTRPNAYRKFRPVAHVAVLKSAGFCRSLAA
jgi:hypothetical protein